MYVCVYVCEQEILQHAITWLKVRLGLIAAPPDHLQFDIDTAVVTKDAADIRAVEELNHIHHAPEADTLAVTDEHADTRQPGSLRAHSHTVQQDGHAHDVHDDGLAMAEEDPV